MESHSDRLAFRRNLDFEGVESRIWRGRKGWERSRVGRIGMSSVAIQYVNVRNSSLI